MFFLLTRPRCASNLPTAPGLTTPCDALFSFDDISHRFAPLRCLLSPPLYPRISYLLSLPPFLRNPADPEIVRDLTLLRFRRPRNPLSPLLLRPVVDRRLRSLLPLPFSDLSPSSSSENGFSPPSSPYGSPSVKVRAFILRAVPLF